MTIAKRTRCAWACAGLLALLLPATAGAQPGPRKSTLKEPVDSQVYQRDRDGRAEIPVVTGDDEKESKVKAASVTLPGQGDRVNARFQDGKLVNVPVGGPYSLYFQFDNESVNVGNVFVGDLWVLAGQSNMEGVGDLVDVASPNPNVMLLGMDGRWSRAEEPLHWLVDSPDPVHSGQPDDREARSTQQHKTRKKGAGLGLPFASAMVDATGVPVGLIACAHGGTSMAQWDPAKKDEGGKSLYGSMLRQIKLAGGKVKGVLWYQGESDADPKAAEAYPKAFAHFIEAVRTDLDQPELPFYFVQIGRVIRGGDPKAWNTVQDAQRKLIEQVPNTAVVSVIDLPLDDGIHVATPGLKRVGRRLANVALRELFGQAGATTPTFDRVNKGAGNTLIVKFKGVNIGPEPSPARPLGPFMNMMSPTAMVPPRPGMARIAGQNPAQPGVGMTMNPMGMGNSEVVGLKPSRHIAGFSIRKEDGSEIPLIFDAAVGSARDTVTLKLTGKLPEKAFLWYGYGFDPYCNLTDGQDMAVPVFGPISLDDLH